jgi:hypothetical protein
MPLHRLVYRSTLVAPGGQAGIAALIEDIMVSARRRNAQQGVTGALLYSGESILQVLEGRLPALEETYDRISADLRHGGLTLLQFVPIAARDFPDWRMALMPVETLRAIWPEAGTAALAADDIPRTIAELVAALPAAERREAA